MGDFLKIGKEILEYIWKTRKWWLVPLICVLMIIAVLIFTTSTAPVPIFVYPLA